MTTNQYYDTSATTGYDSNSTAASIVYIETCPDEIYIAPSLPEYPFGFLCYHSIIMLIYFILLHVMNDYKKMPEKRDRAPPGVRYIILINKEIR